MKILFINYFQNKTKLDDGSNNQEEKQDNFKTKHNKNDCE